MTAQSSPPDGYSVDETAYRMLFDRIDEGFCIIEFIDGPHGRDSDYIHVMANAAYAENAGIPDVVGQKLREMVPAEADAWVARYGEVLRTGRAIRFEQELVATGRHLELAAFRLDPPERKQVAVLFKDITEQKRAKELLEARVAASLLERNILADLVDGTNAIVQVVDRDMRYLAINDAALDEYERLYGVRPAVGDHLLDIVADEDRRALVGGLWARALAGAEFVEIARFRDRHYEMHFNALRGAEDAQLGAFLFAYDVTDRIAKEERLAQAEEALRQAQKMEAVGQLTGGLAHDFNNLLAGISGAFEMIGVRLAQGRHREVDKYLAAGQGAARRAASLTHRLLAFSRRQTLSPKAVVVNRLLAELVELVQRTAGPEIAVETVAAVGLWPAQVDVNQLENAILNLCINARDAMPHGGRMTIETANVWLDARAAAERSMEPGQYVSVCVSDTGTGIDRETLARVFDPFFTTKPQGEGTGLGLSMVYGFARQSHGHVRIYSEVGQGTNVCIYLPRFLGAEDVEPASVQAIAPASGGDYNVLVVDDEPTVRMLVVDALADRGYVCQEAADGATGLKYLRAGHPIDLLITDVGLPGGMNGRQVAEAAREIIPDLKILFITGYAENAALNHGHVGRGMEILTKPFAVEDLALRVERILRRD